MDEKEKEARRKRKASVFVKETKGDCNFTMPELEYLNKKPQSDYLKKPIVKKVQVVRTRRSKKDQPGVFVQPKRMEIKPFTEDDFRVIVSYAQQKRNKKSSVDCRRISHLSDTRVQKLGTFMANKIQAIVLKHVNEFESRLKQYFYLMDQAKVCGLKL